MSKPLAIQKYVMTDRPTDTASSRVAFPRLKMIVMTKVENRSSGKAKSAEQNKLQWQKRGAEQVAKTNVQYKISLDDISAAQNKLKKRE